MATKLPEVLVCGDSLEELPFAPHPVKQTILSATRGVPEE